MIVWHVTTIKKLIKYKEIGFIKPPVRAWTKVEYAEKFSIQTGRRVILRLKFPDDPLITKPLSGHSNCAVVIEMPYSLDF